MICFEWLALYTLVVRLFAVLMFTVYDNLVSDAAAGARYSLHQCEADGKLILLVHGIRVFVWVCERCGSLYYLLSSQLQRCWNTTCQLLLAA